VPLAPVCNQSLFAAFGAFIGSAYSSQDVAVLPSVLSPKRNSNFNAGVSWTVAAKCFPVLPRKS
jgi:hypothetical protein